VRRCLRAEQLARTAGRIVRIIFRSYGIGRHRRNGRRLAVYGRIGRDVGERVHTRGINIPHAVVVDGISVCWVVRSAGRGSGGGVAAVGDANGVKHATIGRTGIEMLIGRAGRIASGTAPQWGRALRVQLSLLHLKVEHAGIGIVVERSWFERLRHRSGGHGYSGQRND
jgi:hypothetical protein